MSKKELFAKYHFKQAIVLGVIAILVVSWQVVLEDTDIFGNQDEGVVRGEAIEKVVDEGEAVVTYQNKVKNIVSQYLVERAEFDKPHQDWLFLINNVKYQILGLTVPEEYKELHVKLAVVLNMEYEVVAGERDIEMNEVSGKWEELLEQYFWLND